MITVHFIIKNAQGVEVAREVIDEQPCNVYELEILEFVTVRAQITEWNMKDGQWLPKPY